MSNDDQDYYPPENDNFVMQQLHDINWFICNFTTPANFFHALRRQMALPFRKPVSTTGAPCYLWRALLPLAPPVPQIL